MRSSSGSAGFSSGSTIASTSAGFGERRAAWIAGRISSGRSQRYPSAPQARAKATKSIGDSSQPNEGLPSSDLLELDLGEAVVLQNDDLDRKIVLDGGRHLRHQHRETAIADDRHRLAVWVGELTCDGEGQSGRHRRHHARAGQSLARPQHQIARGEMGVRAAIERNDRIVRRSDR